jgi:Arc/MetJ-type ribon-helix-helix transcriptional regulator
VTSKYTTVSIPVALHERIERIVKKKGGFKSVSDYATYVLREMVVMHETDELPEAFASKDLEAIRSRLKALGYL